MPAKKREGLGATSTSARRPSNCSERLRSKRGQAPGARDQLLQRRQHLAAVAHAEREGLGPREEARERVARARVEEDRLRPALARAEHVAVGEAAAGDEPAEAGEVEAALDHVGHVDVDALEAGAVEGRRHLDLAVHALLAQDRDARRAPPSRTRGRAATGRRARARRSSGPPEPRAACSSSAQSGSSRRRCMRVGGGAPPAAQRRERLLEGDAVGAADHDAARPRSGAPPRACAPRARGAPSTAITLRQLGRARPGAPRRAPRRRAPRSEPVARRLERDLEAAAAREGHLEQGRDEPAVGAVVVGEHEARRAQLRERGREARAGRRRRRGRALRRRPARTPAPARSRRAGSRPRPRSTSSSALGPRSRRAARASSSRARRVTGAKAVTTSESGAVTLRRTPSSSHTVRIESESLPTGTAMPSAGQSSRPTARTAS